ncbi:MAG: short-chain isoprenyl diphosphate synthase [Lachnospiraceae bacterium]|nr:short-chain isoprenyl diphosphate synthase [Lachnospiraceae bacterium]
MRLSKRILLLAAFISGISYPGRCGSMTGAGNAKMAELMADGMAAGETAAETVEAERVSAVYCAVYEEAMRTNTTGSLDMMRKIIAELGKGGYAAVDSDNQVDMVNPELVLRFCEAVEDAEMAKLTVIVPARLGSFVKYDFETEKGDVYILRGYYQYENGYMQNRSTAIYSADAWQYTEEGYLLFEGSYYTAESYVLVCSDEPEYAAFRTAPLEEKCRELNRKYILPAGYQMNELFLTDWSEEDFAGIDFYDLFDVLYEEVNGRCNPYKMDENPNVGTIYQIPAEEFEGVIMRYFEIDQETLRSRTSYLPQEKAYEYRPRGFYELGYTNIPYPEVVDYEEKPDGTIELIVNAVFPYEKTAKAYSHKVVVRPLQDGGFQYVSNEKLAPEEDYRIWWYSERLSEEAWKETYGDQIKVFR